jgi:CubicO group peptidase (beta-lactamase class C family)
MGQEMGMGIEMAMAPGGDQDPGLLVIERSLRPVVRVQGRPEPEGKTLEARMAELGVAAISAAVLVDGELAWARAWGLADLETGRAATPETLFQAASISKPVAATGALMLVEDGLMELDGPIAASLRRWQVPAHPWSGAHEVTLRGLLTHTAGLTVHGFPGYRPGEPLPDLVQILDGEAPANTGAVRVSDAPGSLWRYSGGGTTVAQMAMEDVTGEPLDQWMERRVLAAAGMSSSTYTQPLPEALHSRAATAYRADGGSPEGRWHVYPEQAAAGLWTTPTDLTRWVQAIQASLEGAPGAILRQETAVAMLTAGEGGWGLGPVVAGEGAARRFSHGGSNHGFKAEVVGWMEGGRGLAIMTGNDQGNLLIRELAMAIAAHYGWEGYEPRMLTEYPLAAGAVEAYLGDFGATPEGPAVRVHLGGGGVPFVSVRQGRPRELVATAEHEFTDLEQGQTLVFRVDEAGYVDAVRLGGAWLERVPD